jgi:hypothetical protein
MKKHRSWRMDEKKRSQRMKKHWNEGEEREKWMTKFQNKQTGKHTFSSVT